MSLIRMSQVGKIYSDKNLVAVGIRGVDLSFDKGEFVAITGKSGSGKSTLLGILGGINRYEEGEMYVEGTETSPYAPQDWEEYRNQYISHIFQDYKIIESFTVLQNVETALLHVENKKERRKIALSMIGKVGLLGYVNHKAGKLSGGQKQRTAIARALAEDNPILLADEPTGNLDAESSKSIMRLLAEIAKEKLVIVVTHNFEYAEPYATRVIRVFNGSIESDEVLRERYAVTEEKSAKAEHKTSYYIKEGAKLGVQRFFAMPKLSLFVSLILTVVSLGVFLMTSLCGQIRSGYSYPTVFGYTEGRTVISHSDATPISDEELKALAVNVGAGYYHYDNGLDYSFYLEKVGNVYFELISSENATADIGEGANGYGVMLDLPLSAKRYYNADCLGKSLDDYVNSGILTVGLTVVGVRYHVDNTVAPRIVITEEALNDLWERFVGINDSTGFDLKFTAFSQDRFENGSQSSVKDPEYDVPAGIGQPVVATLNVVYDDSIPKGQVWCSPEMYSKITEVQAEHGDVIYYFTILGYEWQYPVLSVGCSENASINTVYVNGETLRGFVQTWLPKQYTQASLYFKSDAEAVAARNHLIAEGYCVCSTDTLKSTAEQRLALFVVNCISVVVIVAISVFLVLFASFCMRISIGITGKDIAILRLTGCNDRAVKTSILTQMLLSLSVSYLITVAAVQLLYRYPMTNAFFLYLHIGGYVGVFAILLVLTVWIAFRFIRSLFAKNVDVKKAAA